MASTSIDCGEGEEEGGAVGSGVRPGEGSGDETMRRGGGFGGGGGGGGGKVGEIGGYVGFRGGY